MLLMLGIAALEALLCALCGRRVPVSSKKTGRALLCVFVFSIFYITVWSRDDSALTGVRLVPFWSYALAANGLKGGNASHLWQIILNILLFMPLGIVVPFCVSDLPKPSRFWLWLLAAAAFSLIIESVQYFFGLGVLEIDDLIDNCLGFAAGAHLSVLCKKRLNERFKRRADP